MFEETVERIKELSLRDYIGTIPKNNKVICPKCDSGLKENKTPALHIYKRNGYCFSCNTSFDIINYVMHTEGLGYKKTLKLLANMYGISTIVMGKIWHIGNKMFYNKKKAQEYERELEMEKIVAEEIECRLIINRTINAFMLMGLKNSAQSLANAYMWAIVAWNRRYGRLV